MTKKVVLVRHPLDRLVSAYRMIFQDWCDKDKFIRKKWQTICMEKGLKPENIGDSNLEKVIDGSDNENNDKSNKFNVKYVTNMLSAVYDEFVHGQDRYISRIWFKYHPEKNQNKEKMFKFTFQEFVRFLVNGTKEFADDPYVLKHKSISYHWDPYYLECPVCHPLTRPDYVLHMETLDEDLTSLLRDVNLLEHKSLFPHTHTQRGGHSSLLADQFLSHLTQQELSQVQDKYKLDFQLFGYLTKR